MKMKTNNKGMTLVEVLFAAAISLVVIGGTFKILLQTLKSYQYETGKLLVNRDIRAFTQQMIDDATFANSFQIYDQASNLNRGSTCNTVNAGGNTDPTNAAYNGYTADLVTTAPADPVAAATPGTAKVTNGLPGDVLVFIYNSAGDNKKIDRLIIYYRWIATTAAGTDGTNSTAASTRTAPFKRLVVKIPTAQQTLGVMKLLPVLSATSAQNTIFAYVDGQASDNPASPTINRKNKMFYNIGNASILIRGRIYENYTAQRIVKSTYNFTVTPRG